MSQKGPIAGRRPNTPPDIVEAIKAAPIDEAPEAVAERLGVSRATVIRYRKQARQERQEVAREVIAQHVRDNVPDALGDLAELRRLSRSLYERDGDARQGQLWLGAIKTTLEHVTPDDAELDAAIEAELARAADAVQAGVPGPPARVEQPAAYH